MSGWRKLEKYEHPKILGYDYSYYIPAEEQGIGSNHRYHGKAKLDGMWYVATEAEFARIALMEEFA